MKDNKLHVLLVDDNQLFVDRMIGLLEEVRVIGHVTTAGNYDEAYRAIWNRKPDLILLDINLPGKSGIELLKDIQQSDLNCSVIMISNHANEYYKQQCLNLGADYFLDKSSDFGMIPHLIDQINSR